MAKNVIILTSGLSGASVVTGMIARAGYWTGEEHGRNTEYNAYGNPALTDLNLRLFAEAGYKGNYLLEFSRPAMTAIESLHDRIDLTSYRAFVAKCNEHQPWIWQDPRLWLTMRFWTKLLDLNECQFVLLTRDAVQSWISATLRRQITTYRYSKQYEEKIKESILQYLAENRLRYLGLSYEELIQRPVEAIRRLNERLETGLTLEDLRRVYPQPLYRSPRNSWLQHVKAMLIYLKNYSERLDVAV